MTQQSVVVQFMDLNLADKKVITLASSQGIGRAVASAFTAEGADVVISSRTRENLDPAKDAIASQPGVSPDQIVPVTCDLSDPDSVEERIGEAIDRLGGVDILVTNTGPLPKISFEEATVSQFDDAYDKVLKSIIIAIKTSIDHLEGGGAITNLIAASAQQPEADHILANTIRPSIYGLAKSLAEEYAADGIRVNCVCPKKVTGPVTERERNRTNHIDKYADKHDLTYKKARDEFISQIIPLGTTGDLDDFGKAVAFISSDGASHITGQSLNVDGGWADTLV